MTLQELRARLQRELDSCSSVEDTPAALARAEVLREVGAWLDGSRWEEDGDGLITGQVEDRIYVSLIYPASGVHVIAIAPKDEDDFSSVAAGNSGPAALRALEALGLSKACIEELIAELPVNCPGTW